MCRSGTDKVLPAFPIAQLICCIGLSPRTDSMALFIEQLVTDLRRSSVFPCSSGVYNGVRRHEDD